MSNFHDLATEFSEAVNDIKHMIADILQVRRDDVTYDSEQLIFSVEINRCSFERVFTLVKKLPCDFNQVLIHGDAQDVEEAFVINFHCREGDIPRF